jgi:hypothetical protein
MDETRNAFPLEWPAGWRRTPAARRINGKFNKKETVYRTDGAGNQYGRQNSKDISIIDAVQRIVATFTLMGIDRQDVVISTNVRVRLDGLPRSGEREPDDPGVAVYWRDLVAGKPTRCMAIDRYGIVAHNLAAVAATLDAMRAIERHGGAEVLDRAFSGFLALPEKATQPWRDVLGIFEPVVTRDTVLAKSRDLLLANNPDQGGDRDKYEAIIEARKRALAEVGDSNVHVFQQAAGGK